jgi:hypothetical protein
MSAAISFKEVTYLIKRIIDIGTDRQNHTAEA